MQAPQTGPATTSSRWTPTPTPSGRCLTIEIQDTGTQGYWTRVNYSTVILPGQSTLILPLKQLYVGEKAGPAEASF